MSHVSGFAASPSGTSFTEMPTVTTTHKASVLNIITRAVCRDCNTGWMSRLETEAKPVILALNEAAREGTALLLARPQARVVARWAQKTAMTNELAGHTSFKVATPAMGQRLRDGSPLRGGLVWAAQNATDYWPATALAQIAIGATPNPLPAEQYRHALLTAVVYRYVTFLVFIGGDPGELLAVNPPGVKLDRWALIWPASGSGEYPPLARVDGADLTRTMVDHHISYPLSNIWGFQRSPFPPQASHRN
jgi:hypothetical protein